MATQLPTLLRWKVLRTLPASIRWSVTVFVVAVLVLVGTMLATQHRSVARPTFIDVEAVTLHTFATQFHVSSLKPFSASCLLASSSATTSSFSCVVTKSLAGVRTIITTATVSERKINGANDYQTTVSFTPY